MLTAASNGDVTTEMLLARALRDGRRRGRSQALGRDPPEVVYGVEGRFDVQMVQAERAQMLERLGRTEQAIEALRALTNRYPVRGGDVEPLALVDARQRLRRYEQGRR